MTIGTVVVSMCASFCLGFGVVRAEDTWEVFDTGTQASLRGVAAMSHEVAWACGSQGTIVQTIDGGKSWQRHSIPNLQAVEMRSIHAWDSDKAIVATAGQPALILKTVDRGTTWTTTYENKSPQAFFDGMRFWSDMAGIAFSDPIDGELLILKTVDGGNSWQAVAPAAIPRMDTGEAGFAASNSSLHTLGNELAWIGLGGGSEGASRVFRSQDAAAQWTSHLVPPITRGASSGIFSLAFENERKGIAVGGDYTKTTYDTQNIAITEDGGVSWRAPHVDRPRGFRSCVIAMRVNSADPANARTVWLTCGPSGCDWSGDGEKWSAMSDAGFHTLSLGEGNSVWAAGSEGRVARLTNAASNLFSSP